MLSRYVQWSPLVMMSDEPQVLIPSEEPRYCSACGTRVAAMAKTCLMCGASLEGEEVPPEEPGQELPLRRRILPVVLTSVAVLAGVGLAVYALLNVGRPEEGAGLLLTPTPTVTLAPTLARTPTPSPTPSPIPPLVHQVQEGESLLVIADMYGVSVDDLLALNPGIDPQLLQVNQLLLVPVVPPTATPTPTLDPSVPTPTPSGFIIHVVAPGETLSGIADHYGVSLALLRQVNSLPPGDDVIGVNQALIIPLGTVTPTPSPTADPNATPVPPPPYRAPSLLSPPAGALLASDNSPVLLQWTSVGILREDEWYEVTLFQSYDDARSTIVHTRTTAWRVPADLLMAGRVEGGTRQFFWRVQVVREERRESGVRYGAAGPPSEVRSFGWLEPTPSPMPVSAGP